MMSFFPRFRRFVDEYGSGDSIVQSPGGEWSFRNNKYRGGYQIRVLKSNAVVSINFVVSFCGVKCSRSVGAVQH